MSGGRKGRTALYIAHPRHARQEINLTCSSRKAIRDAGEGVPYLIDHYRVKSADDVWQTRTRELPLGGMLFDFGQPSPLSSGK